MVDGECLIYVCVSKRLLKVVMDLDINVMVEEFGFMFFVVDLEMFLVMMMLIGWEYF